MSFGLALNFQTPDKDMRPTRSLKSTAESMSNYAWFLGDLLTKRSGVIVLLPPVVNQGCYDSDSATCPSNATTTLDTHSRPGVESVRDLELAFSKREIYVDRRKGPPDEKIHSVSRSFVFNFGVRGLPRGNSMRFSSKERRRFGGSKGD